MNDDAVRSDNGWWVDGLREFHRLLRQTVDQDIESGVASSDHAWVKKKEWNDSTFRAYNKAWKNACNMSIDQLRQTPGILKDPEHATIHFLGSNGIIRDDDGKIMNHADLIKLLVGGQGNLIIIGDFDPYVTVEPESPYAEAITLLKSAIAAQGAEIDDAIDTLPELAPLLLDGLRADADVLYKIAYKLNLKQPSLDRLQKIYGYSVKLKNPTPEEQGGNGNGKVNGNGKSRSGGVA